MVRKNLLEIRDNVPGVVCYEQLTFFQFNLKEEGYDSKYMKIDYTNPINYEADIDEFSLLGYIFMESMMNEHAGTISTLNKEGILLSICSDDNVEGKKTEKEALDIVRRVLDFAITYEPANGTFYRQINFKKAHALTNLNKAKTIAEKLKKEIFEDGRYIFTTEE